MGAPMPPKPLAPPPKPDVEAARMRALAYAETQRRIRAGQGRKGSFLTAGGALPPASTMPGKPTLGS